MSLNPALLACMSGGDAQILRIRITLTSRNVKNVERGKPIEQWERVGVRCAGSSGYSGTCERLASKATPAILATANESTAWFGLLRSEC